MYNVIHTTFYILIKVFQINLDKNQGGEKKKLFFLKKN